VGTTVRVQNFLTKIPVRKEAALKGISKTLKAIQGLVFAFAFARRDIRFSLKVLKGKNDSVNWAYAAKPNDSLVQIAAKIVGMEAAVECKPYSISSADADVELEDGWEIDALLVSPGAGRWPFNCKPNF
jgi:DNA mismatch repair ATPase MutL